MKTKSTPGTKTKFVAFIAALVVISTAGLATLPAVSPDTGAAMADALRSVAGVSVVSTLESLSFKLRDMFDQTRYKAGDTQPLLTFADNAPPIALPRTSNPIANTHLAASHVLLRSMLRQGYSAIQTALATKRSPVSFATSSGATAKVAADVLTAPPLLGWQAFEPVQIGNPMMARTIVYPDPTRPYAAVALIRFDLTKINLHLVAGTKEPVATPANRKFPRPGMIPTADQTVGTLLAAFNGGFKAEHGHFGIMANGITILPAQTGLGTLALYQDGSIRIGEWGRGITNTADLAAFRQNCPLLINNGQLTGAVSNDESRWGWTIKNLDTTWRSGAGISADGRYFVYAVGNSLTVESLAKALQIAGAQQAMQLDINGYYTRFETYLPNTRANNSTQPLVAHKLLNQMVGDSTQYLVPYNRDFFYVTLKEL